jgi:hypothetical protein
MQVGTCKFHRRAFFAFHELTSEEQAQVLEVLTALFATPVTTWSLPQVRRLPGEQSLYLVRIDDSWRAFVQAAEGQEPEVMDIVLQDTLDFFARAASRNGD